MGLIYFYIKFAVTSTTPAPTPGRIFLLSIRATEKCVVPLPTLRPGKYPGYVFDSGFEQNTYAAPDSAPGLGKASGYDDLIPHRYLKSSQS